MCLNYFKLNFKVVRLMIYCFGYSLLLFSLVQDIISDLGQIIILSNDCFCICYLICTKYFFLILINNIFTTLPLIILSKYIIQLFFNWMSSCVHETIECNQFYFPFYSAFGMAWENFKSRSDILVVSLYP